MAQFSLGSDWELLGCGVWYERLDASDLKPVSGKTVPRLCIVLIRYSLSDLTSDIHSQRWYSRGIALICAYLGFLLLSFFYSFPFHFPPSPIPNTCQTSHCSLPAKLTFRVHNTSHQDECIEHFLVPKLPAKTFIQRERAR